MSQVEIETKWRANRISRATFHRFVGSIIEVVKHNGWSFKTTGGPDHYYISKRATGLNGEYVARFRNGEDLAELTVKARKSKSNITERVEINIPLDLGKAKFKDVDAWLRHSGYKHIVTITKSCDVYKFKMKGSPVLVHVVYYEVTCKGHQKQAFIEVEVDGGTRKQRLKALKTWSSLLHKKLKLSGKDISDQSLFEIYTGRVYRMAG